MRRLNTVIKDSVQTVSGQTSIRESGAVQLWPDVVGDAVARATRAAYVHQGVLVVEVKSSVWSYELGFYKDSFVTLLNEGLGAALIRDIRFRVRDLPEPEGALPRVPDLVPEEVPAPVMAEVEALTKPVGDPQLRERLRSVLVREIAKREARAKGGQKPCARCKTLHHEKGRLCPLCRMEGRR